MRKSENLTRRTTDTDSGQRIHGQRQRWPSDRTTTRRHLKALSARSGCRAWPSTRPSEPSAAMRRPQEPRFSALSPLRVEPGRGSQRQAGQEQARSARLGELGDDRRSRRPGPMAGDVRARVSRDPGVCVRRADPAVSRCREIMAPTSFAGSSIGSGPSVSTITSPTSGRADPPGRRSRWLAARFAAGFAPYSNGCR